MQFNALETRPFLRRKPLVAALAATLLLGVPQQAMAAPLWPDSPASPVAHTAVLLFMLVFGVGLLLLVGYSFALRDARRGGGTNDGTGDDSTGEGTGGGGSRGALIGALAAFLTLAIFGGLAHSKISSAQSSKVQAGEFFAPTAFSRPSLKVAHSVKPPAGAAYTIQVNAQQFLWRYQYSGLKTAPWNTYSYNELVLPAGVTVMLDFTSSDAEAAWWVPQLGGSITAMPGYNNQSWVRADTPGTYSGAGTIVNGTNYASMTTTVHVVPAALFEAWVNGKQTQIAEAMTALGEERASGAEAAMLGEGKAAK